MSSHTPAPAPAHIVDRRRLPALPERRPAGPLRTSPRYHLMLPTAGRTVMQGWWDVRSTAERMFASWIVSCGSLLGAAVVLQEHAAEGERVVDAWQADTAA
ncbi:hypothetical protein ACWGI9_40665 [Streptomyces sp. NPDC054833]